MVITAKHTCSARHIALGLPRFSPLLLKPHAPHTGQKLQNFFLSQDHRQLLRFFGCWNYFFQVPSPMERDFVKETKSRYGDDNRAWSELPFVREVNLVRANLLRSQYLR